MLTVFQVPKTRFDQHSALFKVLVRTRTLNIGDGRRS